MTNATEKGLPPLYFIYHTFIMVLLIKLKDARQTYFTRCFLTLCYTLCALWNGLLLFLRENNNKNMRIRKHSLNS